MLSRIFRLKKDNKGQGLVEFALVMPLLLFLVLGIIQFGIILNGYITVTHAVREGARLASVGKIDDARAKVIELSNISLLTLIGDPIISPLPTISGNTVTVSASGTIPVIVPLLDVIIGNPFPVSSSTSMRVEVASTTFLDPGGPVTEDPGGETGSISVTFTEDSYGGADKNLKILIRVLNSDGSIVTGDLLGSLYYPAPSEVVEAITLKEVKNNQSWTHEFGIKNFGKLSEYPVGLYTISIDLEGITEFDDITFYNGESTG